MKKVREVMVKEVVSFDPSDPIRFVAASLRQDRISGGPVVFNDKVVGIISERDIMKLIAEHKSQINLITPDPNDLLQLPDKSIHELDLTLEVIKKAAAVPIDTVMTKDVITIDPEADLSEAAKMMGDCGINRLPVVDKEGKLLGIVTRGDIIATLV